MDTVRTYSDPASFAGAMRANLVAMLDHIGQASAIGTPEAAAAQVRAFLARTAADEIVFAGATYDPAVRERSLALAMAQLAEHPIHS